MQGPIPDTFRTQYRGTGGSPQPTCPSCSSSPHTHPGQAPSSKGWIAPASLSWAPTVWKCVPSCLPREFKLQHTDRVPVGMCTQPLDFSPVRKDCNCHRVREDPPKRKLEQGPRLQPHGLESWCWIACLLNSNAHAFSYCVAKRKVHPRTAISTWKLVFEIHCVVN